MEKVQHLSSAGCLGCWKTCTFLSRARPCVSVDTLVRLLVLVTVCLSASRVISRCSDSISRAACETSEIMFVVPPARGAAESQRWPRGRGVDNVRRLGAGEPRWHMLCDRKTPGCCRAERGDGLVADGSDSCRDHFFQSMCFFFLLLLLLSL